MGHTDRAALIAWAKEAAKGRSYMASEDGEAGFTESAIELQEEADHFDAIAALLEAEAWQDISTAPAQEWAQPGTPALLYSTEFGIQRGEIGNWPDGPRGNAAGYHGCAVRDWHVTHWKPLPLTPSAKGAV